MYYIKKVRMTGKNVPDAVVDLNQGVNIIYGPSNTGKSYIIECINYVMGSKSTRIEKNRGYDHIQVTLDVNGEMLTLTRKLGGSSVYVSGAGGGFEEGNYSSRGKRRLNQLWLDLIGIREPHLIHKSGNTKEALGNRSFDHAFIIREKHVDDEDSILHSRDHSQWEKDLSAFLFLMTGNDYDDGEDHQTKQTLDMKKGAVSAFANSRLSEIGDQIEELNKKKPELSPADYEKKISATLSLIDSTRNQISAMSDQSDDYGRKIYEIDREIAKKQMLSDRYKALQTQYRSDLRRLTFMVEGEVNREGITLPKVCPFCGNELNREKSDSCIEAASIEVEKTSLKIKDLQSVRKNLDKDIRSLVSRRDELQHSQDDLDHRISSFLRPQINRLQEELASFTVSLAVSKELETLERIQKNIKDGLNESMSEVANEENFRSAAHYDEQFFTRFNQILDELLKACNFDRYASSWFDINTFDAVVNDEAKNTYGQGYRAFLNVIVSMTMQLYLRKYGKYYPYVFAVDSPILTLKENVDEKDMATKSMRASLFRYMIDHPCAEQIIIIENELPPVDYSSVNLIYFSKKEGEGRYGFWPDARL